MKLRGLTKGIGGSAIESAAGVIGFYAHRMLSSKVAFVQNHPLAAPAAILALGHVMKSSGKLSKLGPALCGIAGYAGAQVFELQKASKQAQTASSPVPGTSGFDDDTGALTPYTDIGALTPYTDIGSFGHEATAGSSYDDAYSLGI
jgi:hypothetical protein